jgi:hypothetical protein
MASFWERNIKSSRGKRIWSCGTSNFDNLKPRYHVQKWNLSGEFEKNKITHLLI